MGYSPWGCQEPDTTERLTVSLHLHFTTLHSWVRVTLRLSELIGCTRPRVNPNVQSGLWLTMMSVQLLSRSVVSDSANPWTAACQASLSITNSRSLRKLMSIESVMPSNHLILCRPLLLTPSILPSIRVLTVMWRFTNYNKCNSGRGQEVCVPSLQFCCELKTVLKKIKS